MFQARSQEYRKAPISFFKAVRPTERISTAPKTQTFFKDDVGEFYENLSRNFEFD
jgi:hypothetical protein